MPRSPRATTIAAAIPALAAAASLLGGCTTTTGGSAPSSSSTSTTEAPAGTTTTSEPSASEGKELYVYAPVEGDCIDLRGTSEGGARTTRPTPGPDATPRSSNQLVLRLPCELPHQYDVIAVVDAGLPKQPPPDDAALTTAAKQLCPAAFATYVGTPYQASRLEVGWVLPSGERRARGIQEIGCLAFDPNGKLTGSVRSSGR